MYQTKFPVIDLLATGENILRLRKQKGLSVRDLQRYFGFEEPQAIYKWQKGKSLPTVDNLYALGALLDVPMEEILVPTCPKLNIADGQQDSSCCSKHFIGRLFWIRQNSEPFRPIATLQPAAPHTAPSVKNSEFQVQLSSIYQWIPHRRG